MTAHSSNRPVGSDSDLQLLQFAFQAISEAKRCLTSCQQVTFCLCHGSKPTPTEKFGHILNSSICRLIPYPLCVEVLASPCWDSFDDNYQFTEHPIPIQSHPISHYYRATYLGNPSFHTKY